MALSVSAYFGDSSATSCLTAFLKGVRSFTGTHDLALGLDLVQRLDLVGIPLLALEGDGLCGGLAEGGLLVLAELVPHDLAHEEDLGQAKVLVEQVVLRDLVVVEGDEGGRVVLGAVDDAGLYRAEDLAGGHGDR